MEPDFTLMGCFSWDHIKRPVSQTRISWNNPLEKWGGKSPPPHCPVCVHQLRWDKCSFLPQEVLFIATWNSWAGWISVGCKHRGCFMQKVERASCCLASAGGGAAVMWILGLQLRLRRFWGTRSIFSRLEESAGRPKSQGGFSQDRWGGL